MANNNAPIGIRPYAYMSGAPYNGAVRTYYVPASNATALYVGDPLITLDNSSDANGVPAVGIATAGAGNYLIGSMQGVSNNAGQLTITVQRQSTVYVPAGQAAYIYVSDDPFLLYEVQEDSVGGAMVVGAASRNASLVAGAGNTTTGISGWQLQSSSLNTTAQQMRIIQALQQADNAPGNAYTKWLCRINQHQLLNSVGT
jgi:hypothetical protein